MLNSICKRFPDIDIQVDGGVSVNNIERIAEAGANVIVSGTGVFKHPQPSVAISTMRTGVAKFFRD